MWKETNVTRRPWPIDQEKRDMRKSFESKRCIKAPTLQPEPSTSSASSIDILKLQPLNPSSSSFINVHQLHQGPVPFHFVYISASFNMTRSHKQNDRNHAALANGTAVEEEHLPRYFAKSGHSDADPKKTKKAGAGRGNWGTTGEEIQDSGFTMSNARRRSNSSSYAPGLKDFKTKFEYNDEPVFEEHLHGPSAEEDELPEAHRTMTSVSESSEGSIDEDEASKNTK